MSLNSCCLSGVVLENILVPPRVHEGCAMIKHQWGSSVKIADAVPVILPH